MICLITTPPNKVLSRLLECSLLTIIDAHQEKELVLNKISSYRPDVIITYRCPHILPDYILNSAQHALNIHPSLLPAYNGLNPWFEKQHDGITHDGVTIHRLTSIVDGGDILMQRPLLIDLSNGIETAREASDELAAEMIIEWLVTNHIIRDNKKDLMERAVMQMDNYSDSRLRKAKVLASRPHQGAYGYTIPIRIDNKQYALKIWKEELYSAQSHMKILCSKQLNCELNYFLPLEYIDNGFVSEDCILPILLMDWVTGISMREYIHMHLYESRLLLDLADHFLVMVSKLHQHHIAHGDLHGTNIIVKDNGELVLIDYDAIYLPHFEGEEEWNKGMLGFQHPARLINKYMSEKIDYFSELVIYTSIIALAYYPYLWNQLDLDHKMTLLFTPEDIESKGQSEIFSHLLNLPHVNVLTEEIIKSLHKDSIADILPIETILICNKTELFDF